MSPIASFPRGRRSQRGATPPAPGLPRPRLRQASASIPLSALLIAAMVTPLWAQDPNNPPPPYQTPSASNGPTLIPRPPDAPLILPTGFSVAEYASGLSGPSTMVLAPNGDLFVAERQGGRVSVYRRTDPAGLPGSRMTFAQGLNTPFGLAFHGDWLYVGTQGALLRYAYAPGQTAASGAPEHVLPLPIGGHSTRNVLFSPKGDKLYLAIGSASNVAEEPAPRATIQEANEDGSGLRTFASGLRNPVGLAWNPDSGKLWAVVNERDGLGDDVPPDYATSVSDGDFYGWPYAYFDGRPDPTFGAKRPDLVAKTRRPDLPIQAHSAPLGIAFYTGGQFPQDYSGSAFIALHGSWNRSQKTGYKVVRSRFQAGQPVGPVEDFMTGFLLERNGGQQVWGRPVGVMVDRDGALLVSDDGGGKIWRVTYSALAGSGDANGDGRVDIQDVVLALRLLVGLDPSTPGKVSALDLWPPGAPDGKLTISDLVALIRKVVMAQ